MLSSLILLITFLLSFLTMPLVNNLGKRLSILDNPDYRKDHTKPLVRLGGLSIYFAFLIPTFVWYLTVFINVDNPIIFNVFYICTFLFFLLGICEDIFHISFFVKLISQILISFYACSQGLIFNLSNLPFIYILEKNNLFETFSTLITIIWIVGIVNAFNWIDGLDGLASGITIITSLGFLYMSISISHNLIIIVLLLGIIGSNFGFLIHNFHPAKIFMGDGGSFFIGSVMALLSLNPQINNIDNLGTFSNITSKILMMGLPLLDMTYVIFNRIINGKSPFYPDRSHFHHRLIDFGLNQKQAVIFCYIVHIGLMYTGFKIM